MNISKSGTNISACMITSINDLGMWLLVFDKEYFIPFADYPGFKESSITEIYKFNFLPPSQLQWKELDINIELYALTKPEFFPLIYKE